MTGEAVSAIGGLATGNDAFELNMAQERSALGPLAAGFGNAALGQAESFLKAPQIDSNRHLEDTGFRGNEYFANNPKIKFDIMELIDDPAHKLQQEDACGPPAPRTVKSDVETAAAGDPLACFLPDAKVPGTPPAAGHAKAKALVGGKSLRFSWKSGLDKHPASKTFMCGSTT